MRVDQRGARMLEACECWDRLSRAASSSIGRIAVNGVRTPYVIPVNFSVMDIGILVPLGPAWTSFHLDGPECTFEVDYVAVQGLAGWSVVVEGTARTVPYDEVARLGPHPPTPRVARPGIRVFAITPSKVTGRSLDFRF